MVEVGREKNKAIHEHTAVMKVLGNQKRLQFLFGTKIDDLDEDAKEWEKLLEQKLLMKIEMFSFRICIYFVFHYIHIK
jgi:hypothetical protein